MSALSRHDDVPMFEHGCSVQGPASMVLIKNASLDSYHTVCNERSYLVIAAVSTPMVLVIPPL